MKVTNGDVWKSKESLRELINKHWPVKTAYWLMKLGKSFNSHLQLMEEVRIKLVEQYGVKNDKGQTEVPKDTPEYDKFQEEFRILLGEEVEVNIDQKILLPVRDDIDIVPSWLIALEQFVEVDMKE